MSAPHAAPPRGPLAWLPTALTLAVLAAVGWWGYRTGWKAPGFVWPWAGGARADESDEDAAVEAADRPPEPEEDLDGAEVTLASPNAARKAGVRVAAARSLTLTRTVRAPGVVAFDQSPGRYEMVSPRVAGTVRFLGKEPGETVAKGELLAVIDAPDVGKAKLDFLSAVAAFKMRAEQLHLLGTDTGSIRPTTRQEVEFAARDARLKLFTELQRLHNLRLPSPLPELNGHPDVAALRQLLARVPDDEMLRRVRLLGLTPEDLKRIDPALASPGAQEQLTANLLPLTAPFDGVLLHRPMVSGEPVGPDHALVVADLRRVWVLLDVRQEEARLLRPGQKVRFRAESEGALDPDQAAQPSPPDWAEVRDTLAVVGRKADEKTRTLPVRAEVANPDGRLRANFFGTAEVLVEERAVPAAVPEEALQWDGRGSFVFVKASETKFVARRVRTGLRNDGMVEVVGKVGAGDEVVTAGSHVLKAELFKGRIAGGD
jgi:membrane fusion protein, heavy metal efflux system